MLLSSDLKKITSPGSSSKTDLKRWRYIFCSSSGSRDIWEKQKVEKHGGMCFFVIYCRSGSIQCAEAKRGNFLKAPPAFIVSPYTNSSI